MNTRLEIHQRIESLLEQLIILNNTMSSSTDKLAQIEVDVLRKNTIEIYECIQKLHIVNLQQKSAPQERKAVRPELKIEAAVDEFSPVQSQVPDNELALRKLEFFEARKKEERERQEEEMRQAEMKKQEEKQRQEEIRLAALEAEKKKHQEEKNKEEADERARLEKQREQRLAMERMQEEKRLAAERQLEEQRLAELKKIEEHRIAVEEQRLARIKEEEDRRRSKETEEFLKEKELQEERKKKEELFREELRLADLFREEQKKEEERRRQEAVKPSVNEVAAKREVVKENPVLPGKPEYSWENKTVELSINDKLSSGKVSRGLYEKLQETPIPSLKKAISINKKFQMINELFKGNHEGFNETVNSIDSMTSLQAALEYLDKNVIPVYHWDEQDELVIELYSFIRRRFM